MRVYLTATMESGALREAIFSWTAWVHLFLTKADLAQDLAEAKENPLMK